MLERWRERDVFRESIRRREGAEPFVFYEGPPTANGRPGSHHVLARVFKDIFPRYQTMLGRYVERKGGWDCHGLPVEIAVEQKLGFTSKDDIERYGIAEFNQQCRESVFEFLEDWTALTERIGYWVDLEHPYRTLDPDYIESVWWALKTMWDKRPAVRGPQGRALLRALRHRAVLARGRAGLRGRRGPVDLRDASRSPSRAGALRAGDRAAGVDDDAVDAASPTPRSPSRPTSPYVRTEDGYVLAEARVTARARRGRAGRRALPRRATCSAPRYEPPFDFITDGGVRAQGPHRAARRLRQRRRRHRHRPHRRSRSARTTTGSAPEQGLASSTRSGSTAPTTSASARTPAAGSRTPTPTSIEDLRGARPAAARRDATCTPTRTAGAAARRCSTTPSRPGTSAPRSCATACWPPTRPSTGTRSTSSTGASAAGWRTTSTGRSRASATGARRCRCGAARTATPSASARSPSWTSARGETLEDPHRPYVDDAVVAVRRLRRADAARARGDRRLVRLGLRCRSPSTTRRSRTRSMFEQRFPADYICEAIDQTRGWFYSLIAVSTLLFDRSPYRDGAVPRAHRRSRGQEDVEVARQHRRAVGGHRPPRRRRLPLVLPDLQAAVGRLPVLDRDGRRVACASSCSSSGTRTASTCSTRTSTTSASAASRRPSSTAGRSRACRRRSQRCASGSTTTTPRAPATRSRRSSTTSPTGTCAARGRRFWDGDPAAFGTLHTCLVDGREAARAVHAVHRRRDLRQPRRRRAERAPVRLPGGRRARRRARGRRWASCARPCGSGWPRAGSPSSRCASRCAPPWWSPPARERAAIERLDDVVREELNVKELRYVSQADELGSYEVKPNYRALGPRFGKQMPQVAAAVAALDPAHVAERAARRARASAISVDGHDHELGADDLLLAMQPLDGYQLEREGSHAVALELELDDELRREGLAREVVHAVQNARKDGRPRGRGPDRAHARRRRRAARRRARVRGLPHAARRSPSRSATTARRTASEATIKGRPLRDRGRTVAR